jgi:hypothetical protein
MADMTITRMCSKCNIVKPLSEFHKCKINPSGYQGYCCDCFISYFKEYRKKHDVKIRLRNPKKRKAQSALSYYVECGQIKKASQYKCRECGKHAHEYHHHLGYSTEHWFDVVPLCRKCHKSKHRT